MKARTLPIFVLGLALLAPACGEKGGAETAGQTIRAATTYNLVSYAVAKRRAPKSWRGRDLHGASLASSAFAGAVTVVNFWASWCGPCRAEQAELEKIHKEYRSKGVKFVGVNIRDTNTNARAHVDEFGVTYPSVLNQDSTIAFKYRVLFIPTTFVLDENGKIAAKIIGPTHEADLIRVIEGELT